jgi:hypothetical protein
LQVSKFGNAGHKSDILKLTPKNVKDMTKKICKKKEKRYDKKIVYKKIVVVNWKKI